MTVAQLLVNGAALGAAYALVAVGFVLILNATGAVNFAHGDLVMAGGMLAAVVGPLLPVPGAALLPIVAALMAVLGTAVGALGYLPLHRRPPASVFISMIAVGIILQNGALLLFGPEPRGVPALVTGGVRNLGGLVVADQSLAIVVVAVVLIGGLHWVFARTQFGRRLRATAQDPEMARACGVPVVTMILATFALGAAYAGIAGLLLANQYFVTPSSGADLILKSYIAVTIGGWGSVPGAVAGAFLIAGFEVLVSAWLSHPVAIGALYVALLLVLTLRPQGLFGEAARRRA